MNDLADEWIPRRFGGYLDWFPPGCRARKCSFFMSYDMVGLQRVFQHNAGLEEVLLIPDYELVRVPKLPKPFTTEETLEMHIAQRLLRWTTRVHAYQEEVPIPEWALEENAVPLPGADRAGADGGEG